MTALINAASLARKKLVLFIVEDAQWIDAVSESMLFDFVTVVPRTPSLVLITCHPIAGGALMRTGTGARTVTLAPLDDSETARWSMSWWGRIDLS